VNDALITIAIVIIFIFGPFWLIYKLDKRVRNRGALFTGQPTRRMELLAIVLGVFFAGLFFILLLSFQTTFFSCLFLVLAIALMGYGLGAGQLLNKLQSGHQGAPSYLRGHWTKTAIGTLDRRIDEPFTEYKNRILRNAGWLPERHVLSKLKLPSGFDLLEPARLVLDEFGGLSLKFVYTSEYNGILISNQIAIIVIDPALCAEEIEKESISEHSQEIGHPLYPLGVYYDDKWDPSCSTILIDDLGRLFLIAFWMDTFLGETFDIALDNLLAGEKGKSIDRYGQW
jgi:hypothetical protein